MRIALIGAGGLVGQALSEFFIPLGHEFVIFKRDKKGVYQFSPSDFDGVQAVINLAGETVSQRWTEKKKEEILSSRVNTTKSLAHALSQMKEPPEVIINASAIGYYGDRKDQIVDESSGPGTGFLSQVVIEWEKAMQVPHTRIVFARIGVILSAKGGALKKMLLPFKLGLGGQLGDGKQMMSWIAIEDVVRAIQHILKDRSISGPVNLVSPNPVHNKNFTKTLGKVLHRPTFFTVPAFAVRAIFGEMGEGLLLSSTCVNPKVLLDTGYKFSYPFLEQALNHEVNDG